MIVSIFVIVLGAFLLVGALTLGVKSYRVRGFPRTTGRVVEREIGPSTSAQSNTGKVVEPRVRYTYQVNGKEYSGSKIGLDTRAYDPASAKRVLAAIPDEVEVHYNPTNPEEAYLEPSSLGLAIVFLLFGAGAFIGGALSLLASRSQ